MKSAIIIAMALLLLATAIYAQGLKITEIDVHVDYDDAYTYRIENRDRKDSATVSLSNNSKIETDIFPGANVTFTVRVENIFQGEDPDIKGVFVTTTIEEIDDGADLTEESLDFDLEPGDDYRFDIKFSIPLDTDSGTYITEFEAEGEDRNGTSYRDLLPLKLEVRKQSHDIRITRTLLNPAIVECDRKIKLSADITNVGSNAENQLALEFKSDQLRIDSKDSNIFLESSVDATEDEIKYTKNLNVQVPRSVKAGVYPILLNLYWKNFVLFDQKTENLIVKDCGAVTTEEEPEDTGAIIEEGSEELVDKEDKRDKATTASPLKGKLRALTTPVFYLIVFIGFVILIITAVFLLSYLKRR